MEGRLWVRLMKKNRCLEDVTVHCLRTDPQEGLREALSGLDIGQPMWLSRHQADWEEYALTRFLPEHFVERVPFDRMEISFIFPEDAERPARRKSPQEDA